MQPFLRGYASGTVCVAGVISSLGFQHLRHVIADQVDDSQVMAFHQGFEPTQRSRGTQQFKATLSSALLSTARLIYCLTGFIYVWRPTDRHLAGVCRWSGGVCP